MFISALCIVKNEAVNLPVWLDNMRNVADELIVVDTGSTDNTAEIARNGGVNVIFYTWQNDFSAARNFALSKAKGDVIIFLDADEYYPQNILGKLRLIISQSISHENIAGILAPRIDIDAAQEGKYIDSSLQCRIFRKGCKYRGIIHESLRIPDGMRMFRDDRLQFYHTGYSTGILKEKLQRNLVLLLAKIEKPGYIMTPLDYRYLLDCYYGLADYEQALAVSDMCLQYARDLADEISYIYKIRVKAAIFAGKSQKLVLQILNEAMERGNKAYFLQLTGQYLWQVGEQEKALPFLQAGLEMSGVVDAVDPVNELLPVTRKLLGMRT